MKLDWRVKYGALRATGFAANYEVSFGAYGWHAQAVYSMACDLAAGGRIEAMEYTLADGSGCREHLDWCEKHDDMMRARLAFEERPAVSQYQAWERINAEPPSAQAPEPSSVEDRLVSLEERVAGLEIRCTGNTAELPMRGCRIEELEAEVAAHERSLSFHAKRLEKLEVKS